MKFKKEEKTIKVIGKSKRLRKIRKQEKENKRGNATEKNINYKILTRGIKKVRKIKKEKNF